MWKRNVKKSRLMGNCFVAFFNIFCSANILFFSVLHFDIKVLGFFRSFFPQGSFMYVQYEAAAATLLIVCRFDIYMWITNT